MLEPHAMHGTIMVVDDDEDIREGVSKALQDEGYRVYVARDGVDALEVLATMNRRPCLVLLDMMMPRMDGNEFLAEISRSPWLAEMPVIVVSAYAGAVHAAAHGVVEKPFDLEALMGTVAELCKPKAAAAP